MKNYRKENHTKIYAICARLSGSPEAQKAVEWAQKLMTNLGFDTVFLQEVMVPHWVRGEKETAILVSAGVPDKPLNVCALGGSVATPKQGIRAEVVEVKSFE
jgi:carboxypeptidase Q